MSSEVLSRAAALMRKRAEAATPSPWSSVREPGIGHVIVGDRCWVAVVGDEEGNQEDAEHAASWHPTLALRISDWLLRVADDVIRDNYEPHEYESAVDIANLYLGEQQP